MQDNDLTNNDIAIPNNTLAKPILWNIRFLDSTVELNSRN